jgi:type IV pilus assembly protein PilB
MSAKTLEIFLRDRIIDEQKAAQVRQVALQTRKPEEQILLELGYASDIQLAKAKSEEFNIPFVDFTQVRLSNEVLGRVDNSVLKTYLSIPFEETDSELKIAMVDPFDIPGIQALQRAVPKGKRLSVYIAPRSQIEMLIEKRLSEVVSTEVHAALEDVDENVTEIPDTTEDIVSAQSTLINAPVARILNSLLTYGVRSNASDVHVEALESEVRIRFRIHGVLVEKLRLPKAVNNSLVARIKILAKLKIDEKRIPQDGRFQIRVKDRVVDIRVSTMPTVYGEKVVMRLLERTGGIPSLESTGLRGTAYKTYLDAIRSTNGIILISGPTGSGKTRTLAGTIARLNTANVNILTLEDPVEIRIAGVNQVQINPDAGLTFASGLRSFLRQDPNIIMVGEIRDKETAGLAVQAALTGHLVFSTIHTNSASAALPRLIDMNVEPYLIASVLQLVVAQRLTRKICPHCRVSYVPPPELMEDIVARLSAIPQFNIVQYVQGRCKAQESGVNPASPVGDASALASSENQSILCPVDKGNGKFDVYLYKGEGCDECGNSGYSGRIGIFEVLKVDDVIGRMILDNKSSTEIQAQAIQRGMITMIQDGYLKALDGITTIEEVLRVSKD